MTGRPPRFIRIRCASRLSLFIIHYSLFICFPTFFLSPIDSHPPSSYNKNCHMPGRQGYRRDTGCCRDRVETPQAGMSRQCRNSKALSNAASLPCDAEACTAANGNALSPCRPSGDARHILCVEKEGLMDSGNTSAGTDVGRRSPAAQTVRPAA